MKKQKICIIGDGLTGLTAALALKTLNLDIDLFYSKKKTNSHDKRITAISESNYSFVKKILNLSKNKIFWSCKSISLFYENRNEVENFLNFNENKNLMHIFENEKYKKETLKKIKSKNINLINKSINKIDYKNNCLTISKKNYFYDLIILCTGPKSVLYEKLLNERAIKKDYEEVAITGYVEHKLKINNPSQYFLKEGPLAILPFNKFSFSFVWSLNKKFYLMNKNNLREIVKKKINNLLNIKSKLILSKIQFYPIFLNLETQYYKKNILILGEGIHSVHPIAGQGFNLVLRDIAKLYQYIYQNMRLGLPLRNSLVLKQFFEARKPENTIFGLGIDLTNTFFKENKFLDPIKEKIIKNISKFESVKKISKIISDKGINF